MSVVDRLRQNTWPPRTSICVRLGQETSDADLAQALEQNPIVTKIDLNLEGVQQANWNALLRVIATRANLETVKLCDAVSAGRRNTPAGLVCSILQAIQQNTSIRTVRMWVIRLPADISMFLDKASSITSFSLYDCDMDPAERGQGASDLAAALQRNKTIECLELRELEDIYSVPILEGLQLNNSLKTLIFHPSLLTDATSSAIQHLLESTTSIQKFESHNHGINIAERMFRPIAQGITNSESVSELKFHSCVFDDRNSFAQLQSILQNKRNLTSLCLHYCSFGGGQVHEVIISTLSRQDSLLRCFEFQSRNNALEGEFPNFRTLLRAIEKSKLERFKIGINQIQQQMRTLAQSIPSMKLKELVIQCNGAVRRDVKEELIQALKNNFTLLSVKFESYGRYAFDNDDDKARLAFYRNRNTRLDQWVDNPETVEQQKVWPEALNRAQRAGPGSLFRGLRSVLQSDYVSFPVKRKRKRPQYHDPS